MAVLFLLAFLVTNNTHLAIYLCALLFIAVIVSFIDYQHYIIPDELSLGMILLGVLSSCWNPWFHSEIWYLRLCESIAGTVLGGGTMYLLAWFGERVFHKEALGGGDIKLMAGVGAFLGWKGVFSTIFISSLFGSVCGTVLLLTKRKQKEDAIPFGPFLCVGFIFYAFLTEWVNLLLFP